MLISNRYELLEQIGQGFMGTVHRAQDRLTNDLIALKQVRIAANSLPHSTLRMRFAQEFRILAALRHPHIISVLDYGFDENHQPYFTMDYIANAQTFIQAIEDKPLQTQISLIIQLLQALTYLHRRNVLHRDVKPANVLVTNDHLRVLDFGLSGRIGEEERILGTPAYMAPEVLQGHVGTAQSDLYAVGIMIYEMIVGELPYDPMDIMTRFDISASLLKLEDHPLTLVLTRLLLPDPDDRYTSADETIEAICRTMEIPVPPETRAIRESYLQTAPFVGRNAELTQLEMALDHTIEGHGSSWLIGGESGIGKSRLLDELRIKALVQGALVVRGQGVEGGGLPYQVWRDLLPRLILSTPLSDEEINILKLILPQIGGDVPKGRPLDSKQSRQKLMSTIANVLRRQTQPIVIILEDLQWATESLFLLQYLSQIVEDEPWLLVGSYRQEESPNLPDEIENTQTLLLKRLDEHTISEMSYAILGEAGKQQDIIDLLQRETEGNAYFVVEVVRELAEEAGKLSDISNITLPSSIITGGIQQISQRRLSRVPRWGHNLLKYAAVIGRQIDEILLSQFVDGVSIDAWLNVCANVLVLEVVDNRWRFSHDKIREAVVVSLPDDEAMFLHRQVAQAIESLYPDDIQQAQILAGHWRAAGDQEKDAYYSFKAAEHLHQLGLEQAQRLALHALELNPSDPLLWAKICNLVANNYYMWGDYKNALTHFEAALAHSRNHDLASEELVARDGIGQIVYVSKDIEAALKMYQEAVELARSVNDNVMLVRLLKGKGVVMRFLGDHEGAYHVALESLEVVRKLDKPLELALVLYTVSVIIRNKGEYEEASKYLEEGIAIFRKHNTISDLGHSLNNLGICNTLMGNYDKALDYLEEGMECRRQVGHVRGVASSKSAIGDLYFLTGRYPEAENMYSEALEFWESIGDRWNTANSHADVGFPLFIRGEFASAEEHWRTAFCKSHEIKGTFVTLKAMIGFAWLAHQSGDTEYALKLLSIAKSHESSTKPLEKLWIQPLMQKIGIDVLTSPASDDFDKILQQYLEE